jgi:flavin-binding protein dodecin
MPARLPRTSARKSVSGASVRALRPRLRTAGSRSRAPRTRVAPGRQSVAPASVVRITEATGDSPRGWEAAVAVAVKASDAKSPIGVEVLRLWAEWDGRALSRYHATVKVAYRQSLKAPAR